jgi:hypothetical protein
LLLLALVMRRMVFAVCLLAAAPAAAATPPACPGTATVTVFVENLSGADAVDVVLDGELAADAATCTGAGETGYEGKHFHCVGHGALRCGELTDLRPGLWVHRLAVSVPGSDPQRQSQRLVVTASGRTHVSNALVWTVYPRTFAVTGATAEQLREAIDGATAFTLCNPGPALVTFSPDAFPGVAQPQRIALETAPRCDAETCGPLAPPEGCPYGPGATRADCADGTCKTAGLCVAADRLVVDALDRDGRAGGVILSVGTCQSRALRVYGSDDVFRGLVVEGSQKPNPAAQGDDDDPPIQVDAVAVSGSRARRNRIEHSLVVGPTFGDAVAVDDGAGQADAAGGGDNVIVDSELTGAADKGLKIDDGFAAIVRSCVHDNRNGGIQATHPVDAGVNVGGHVSASENVVQHNVPGRAQNGLSVRGRTASGRSTLATEGNVVRFSGARGVSVTDNAAAMLQDDYVADNQIRGSTVDATLNGVGSPPAATFRGVALICNRRAGLTGLCAVGGVLGEAPCAPDTAATDCCLTPAGSVDPSCAALASCRIQDNPRYGAVTFAATGRNAPDVSYGDSLDPGRNVFASNAQDSGDANFRVDGLTTPIAAQGNQWQHCASGAPCSLAQDLSPPGALVDVGVVGDPHATDEFVLDHVSPSRPRAGDIVRVYGRGFDAVDGNPTKDDCTSALPACVTDADCDTGRCVDGACPCSITNPKVQAANRSTVANRLRLRGEDGAVVAVASQSFFYPDAVTPTMLAFRMPFDCFAPLRLEVTKHDADRKPATRTITLCDPQGCSGQPAGTPCEDGSVCTTDDRCDGSGACAGGSPLACDTCQTCDAGAGCVPSPRGAACDDGNACTQGDHCDGSSTTCIPGVARVCDGECATGACDPAHGCAPKPAGFVCRAAAGVCDVAETCDGTHDVCPADGFADRSKVCRPAAGPCDSPETCTGRDGRCGRDAHRLPTFVCRPSAGACDVPEHCDGVSDECPPDTVAPAATVCRPAAGACDAAETCTGVDAACPPDFHQPAGVVCRPVAGDCDVAEACDGSSATCPADLFKPPTTVCRPPAGVCDVAETCSGTSPVCALDAVAPATTVCRRAMDPCDVDDTCDGTSRACPATDVRKTGEEGVTCAFTRAMPAPSCVDQSVPPRIPGLFGRAGILVGRAFTAHGAKRCARLRRASHGLASDVTIVDHEVHRERPAISLDCATALRSVLNDARDRVRAEIASACARRPRRS